MLGPIIVLSFICIIVKIGIIEKTLSLCIELLLYIAKIGTQLPLNQINVVTPNLFQIIIYYLIIFLVIFFIKNNIHPNKTILKKYLNIAKYKLLCIGLILCVINFLILSIPKDLKIYFIDVGQGDSTLIVTPNNKNILIDGGGSETEDVRKKYITSVFIG